MGPGGVQGTCAHMHAALTMPQGSTPLSSRMQVGSMPDALMCLLFRQGCCLKTSGHLEEGLSMRRAKGVQKSRQHFHMLARHVCH